MAPYQPLMAGPDPAGSDTVPQLQVSTQQATTVVNGGASNTEANGKATLRVSAGIVVGAIALLWLSAYALK